MERERLRGYLWRALHSCTVSPSQDYDHEVPDKSQNYATYQVLFWFIFLLYCMFPFSIVYFFSFFFKKKKGGRPF